MVEYGIASENYRKLVSGDDSASIDANDGAVADALMYNIFQKGQKLELDKVLLDHGLLATFWMDNNFRFIITLPPESEILVAQSGQKIGTYKLKNLQLEYETIGNRDIANEVSSLYSPGRSLLYE